MDVWEEAKAAQQNEVETGKVKKRKHRSDAGVSKKKMNSELPEAVSDAC